MNKDNQLISERYKTILLKENEQKVLTKEDIEDFLQYSNLRNKLLVHLKKIGSPESGEWTQEQHDEWRKDAENYAQEWDLDVSVDDYELQNEISTNLEHREDSAFWKLIEKLGVKNDELKQEIGQAISDLVYYLKYNPKDFDKDLEEANKKLFFYPKSLSL